MLKLIYKKLQTFWAKFRSENYYTVNVWDATPFWGILSIFTVLTEVLAENKYGTPKDRMNQVGAQHEKVQNSGKKVSTQVL